MGLDTASVQFLCAARSLNVDFARTVMIGRQLFAPDPAALRRVFSVLGIDRDAKAFLRENRYGEAFFSLLGATEVASLDYSAYKGAGIVHDLNLPIPDELRGRFSVVHDGGTIEHVFNVCQALKNCMEMVAVGGHFTQVNVANNFMGHGFWQFSPEVVFRALSENGYEVVAVLLHEVVPGGGWWVVTDPQQARARVEMCNAAPTYILTVARRVALADVFARAPQQSDYATAWDRPAGAGLMGRVREATGSLRPVLFRTLQRLRLLNTLRDVSNRPYYRRIREDDLLRGRLA